MTDISKYKNVSLSKETWDKATKLKTKLLDVPISRSQIITLGVNIIEHLVNTRNFAYKMGDEEGAVQRHAILTLKLPQRVSFQKPKQIQG